MRRSIAPGKVPHACCGRITVERRLLAAVMPPFMPPLYDKGSRLDWRVID